jgi:hypothetical protein
MYAPISRQAIIQARQQALWNPLNFKPIKRAAVVLPAAGRLRCSYICGHGREIQVILAPTVGIVRFEVRLRSHTSGFERNA